MSILGPRDASDDQTTLEILSESDNLTKQWTILFLCLSLHQGGTTVKTQIREVACLYLSANLGRETAGNYLLQPFRAFRKDHRDKLSCYVWRNILQRELFSCTFGTVSSSPKLHRHMGYDESKPPSAGTLEKPIHFCWSQSGGRNDEWSIARGPPARYGNTRAWKGEEKRGRSWQRRCWSKGGRGDRVVMFCENGSGGPWLVMQAHAWSPHDQRPIWRCKTDPRLAGKHTWEINREGAWKKRGKLTTQAQAGSPQLLLKWVVARTGSSHFVVKMVHLWLRC